MFETFSPRGPMYDETMIAPMRDELLRAGFEDIRTPEEVDRALRETKGPVLVVVNSVCGCAAGVARPGIVESLKHSAPALRKVTVFAGQDKDATARVREYLSGYPPSSPAAAIFENGQPVFVLSRQDIQGRTPGEIARRLQAAYEQFCPHPAASA